MARGNRFAPLRAPGNDQSQEGVQIFASATITTTGTARFMKKWGRKVLPASLRFDYLGGGRDGRGTRPSRADRGDWINGQDVGHHHFQPHHVASLRQPRCVEARLRSRARSTTRARTASSSPWRKPAIARVDELDAIDTTVCMYYYVLTYMFDAM